jgi:hypothetical protein
MGNCFSYCCSVDESPVYYNEEQFCATPETSSRPYRSDLSHLEGRGSGKSPDVTSLRSGVESERSFNLGDSETTPLLGQSSLGNREDDEILVFQRSPVVETLESSSAARCITSRSTYYPPSEKAFLKPYIQLATSETRRTHKDTGLLIPLWYTTLTSLTTRARYPTPQEPPAYLHTHYLRTIYYSESPNKVLQLLRDIVQNGAPSLLPIADRYFQPLL